MSEAFDRIISSDPDLLQQGIEFRRDELGLQERFDLGDAESLGRHFSLEFVEGLLVVQADNTAVEPQKDESTEPLIARVIQVTPDTFVDAEVGKRIVIDGAIVEEGGTSDDLHTLIRGRKVAFRKAHIRPVSYDPNLTDEEYQVQRKLIESKRSSGLVRAGKTTGFDLELVISSKTCETPPLANILNETGQAQFLDDK